MKVKYWDVSSLPSSVDDCDKITKRMVMYIILLRGEEGVEEINKCVKNHDISTLKLFIKAMADSDLPMDRHGIGLIVRHESYDAYLGPMGNMAIHMTKGLLSQELHKVLSRIPECVRENGWVSVNYRTYVNTAYTVAKYLELFDND